MDALDLNDLDGPSVGVANMRINEQKQGSGDAVRSKAVVTYSAAKYPALFSQLAPFTNLNLAPSNWLRNAPGLRPGVILSGNRAAGGSYTQPQDVPVFSSFQMADSHLQYMGEIDVVSDAENIKKLLKVPYSKAHVSMAVHRVGRTLLLEQFDVTHESLKLSDWDRFKSVFRRLSRHEMTKKKLPSAQLDRLMLSKFLYYSCLQDDEVTSARSGEMQNALSIEEKPTITGNNSDPIKIASDPENPMMNVIVPAELRWKYWTLGGANKPECQDVSGTFERTIFWTFEDLQMLLGTNMPIFGGGEYPAVSLRLRDSNKPINILTGIDYWLDNLICNVPEVVMCFHVNGIVQNYEVIKTEEIPKISDKKFNPKVIKDIAQNILSFLKSNCTKEGHTYWLFKGSNEDVVKLYDLTTLCNQKSSLDDAERENNPFTISVATLLYKMAINMMQQPIKSREHNNTIKKLLRNCVVLLEKRTQLAPVMFDAALCMLSTLCLPDSNEDFKEDDVKGSDARRRTDSVSRGNDKEATEAEIAVITSVRELSVPDKYKDTAPSCGNEEANVEHGCDVALSYVIRGLEVFSKCAEYSIPTEKHRKDLMIVHVQTIRNTTLIYYTLATRALASQDYGRSLRCIQVALRSYEYLEHLIDFQLQHPEEEEERSEHDIAAVLEKTIPPDFNLLLPRILVLCGDVQMMQTQLDEQDRRLLRNRFYDVTTDDVTINSSLAENFARVGEKYEAMTSLPSSGEDILLACRLCYETALSKLPTEPGSELKRNNSTKGKEALRRSKVGEGSEGRVMRVSVSRKLGHVANEQGALRLNEAIRLLEGAGEQEEEEVVWRSSYSHLEVALKLFTDADDVINQALVLSNLGRLMRVCAQSTAQRQDGGFTSHERQLYDSAIEYYRKALALQQRKARKGDGNPALPSVNDNISWELSGAYFTMARRLQDHAPLHVRAQEEVEREILDLLSKSLKSCSEIWRKSDKRPQAQLRCAEIYSRVASLYHNSFRQAEDATKRRHYRGLADAQYERACSVFASLPDDHACEHLRVILERAALKEQQIALVSSHTTKIKLIGEGMRVMGGCGGPLAVISASLRQEEEGGSTSVDPRSPPILLDRDDCRSLVEILSTILKNFLLSLLKLTLPSSTGGAAQSGKRKPQKHLSIESHARYKHLYTRALRSFQADESLPARVDGLRRVINELET